MLRTVQFVNGLLGHQANGLFVNGLIYSSYPTNCHVHALFVNGIDEPTNSHVHEWDVILRHFLHQYGELSLASSTGNAGTYTTIKFQLPWAG